MDVNAEAPSEERTQNDSVAISLGSDVGESPPIRSALLLCPSNWRALKLLDSSPVFLATRRDSPEQQESVERESEEEEDVTSPTSAATGEDTVREGLDPRGCSKGERETQVSELYLAMEMSELDFEESTTATADHPPSPPSHPHHPPPSHLPLASLQLDSLLLQPNVTTCAPPLLPQTTALSSHHQLSITMEMDETAPEVTNSPSSEGEVPRGYRTHSRNVSATHLDDGSIPEGGMGVLVEGEIPRRYDYQTHSRNVSGTPSVPPFYSSSTSSAYHSRNSSLVSQISSSCFESDSMLSQLTDVDSCRALGGSGGGGNRGDLKQQPIRLQDSRYRLSDSSPTSYSSDLILHHHMTQPIGSQDSPVLGGSPNLDETLCTNKVLQSVQGVAKSRKKMKSSEWIKRQIVQHKDALVQVKVSSKSKHVVHFNVKAGDVIVWEFATKKRDVAFCVSFEATEVATAETLLASSEESPEKAVVAILPMFRVNSHGHPFLGSHTATQDGVYEIIWDNSYSRFFAKELYYHIATQPCQPNVNYLQQ